MADIVLSPVVNFLIEKAISFAAEEIDLLLGSGKCLSKMKENLQLTLAVLRDAERQQQTNDAVKLCLKKLENCAFEADNVLDEINYESLRRKAEKGNQKKRKFGVPGVLCDFGYERAKKIREITSRLTEIHQELKKYNLQPESDNGADSTTSQNKVIINRDTLFFDVSSDFVGRDDDVSKMVEDLIANKDEIVSVITIVGMAGIGKTTLARRLSNHPKIQQHFASSIWVCISKIEVNRVLQLIQESLRVPTTKEESTQARVNVLREKLKDRRYLLVLDDVWDISEWDDFLKILKDISSSTTMGNCILVTTRQQEVAFFVGTSSSCSLKTLSDDECWLILKKKAFVNREVLPKLDDGLGLEIAQKCQGLPLAASTLGGILRNKEIGEWFSIAKSGLQTSGGGDNIMQILRLSYDYLPFPALKKCFAYLSIFPKDSEMKRDDLIQLWIAEGFLHPNPRPKMEMEDIGHMFFNFLLQHSLLQEEERDNYGNVLCCKMHDLVHDLALTISGFRSANVQDSRRIEDDADSVRYLSLGDECGNGMASNMIGRFRLTSTLFLDGHICQDISLYPMSLRVLKFSSSHLKELPDSIDKLIHLRYLDLSSTNVKDLPDFVCKLYNLQTLIVGKTKIPHTLKDLVNLRCLDYSTSIYESHTPIGLGCLTSLHFLPFFNVSQEKGQKLEELRNLKYLSRSLQIFNLELVNGREEARQANLCEKPNLDELTFTWKEYLSCDNRDADVLITWEDYRSGDNQDADVLEGLEPHKNLKGLVIENFLGNHLSPWITKLDKLMKLKLEKCKLKELPALGHLPFLSNLELVDLDDVACLCPSFSSQPVKKIFASLKRLSLVGMPKLIEWVEATGMPTTGVVFFPVLEELTIERCGNLASFPNHVPRLKKLHVREVGLESSTLAKICSQATALTELYLFSVSRVDCLPDSMLFNMPNLKTLILRHCCELMQMWKADDDVQESDVEKCGMLGQSRNHAQHILPSVEEFRIEVCKNLKSIQIPNGRQCLASLRSLLIWDCESLTRISSELVKSTTSLKTLTVSRCPNLKSFPIDLQNLTLSILRFRFCRNYSMPEDLSFLRRVRDLGLGPLSNSEKYYSTLYRPNAFLFMSSLRSLQLWGFKSWKSLPDQLQSLSNLESLILHGFGVQQLPDWFGELASLRDLGLWHFEELEYLPSGQFMRRLKLEYLLIIGCPKLKERLTQQSGPDSERSKISHIPSVEIDFENFKITP